MTGFFVRDQESKLQGFITCTTFTNWQKSFRWDSVHEASFSYDDNKLSQQMLSGERVHDADGILGAGLQQTIHCGDPWNEGIVWPRIAEISLLGGLGCGKALLSMALERLETLKATGRQNYDYVVLQATENSVPFYESMGFVRVGALTVDSAIENMKKSPSSSDDETESDESAPNAVPVATASPADSLAAPSEIVSSPVTVYVVEKAGESPLEIAKKFNVSVWDVVYLNHYLYKDLTSRSWLKAGTSLYIPSESKAKEDACAQALTKKDLEGESSAPKWYVAFENDTPKSIARKFGVACKELVEANIARLPELLPISRLKQGTRVKVSHFHLHDEHHVPYCHWTFPDDKFENAEPSYMMAKKIKRRTGNAAKVRPVQSSLAVPVSKYVKPLASLFHVVTVPAKTPVKKAKAPKPVFNLPGKPKRALSAYIIFCNETRGSISKQLAGKPATEYSKILSAHWKQISDKERAVFQRKHESAKKQYEKALQKYERNLERFFEKHPEMRPSDDAEEEEDSEGETLFNQVVTVKPGTLGEEYKDVEYFYVLTYIPDLVWCHLAPMRLVGYWGEDKPQCQGRPIWMLVDESEGKEVDISASFCQQVKSRGMKRTVDADNEQWDIPDSGRARKLPSGTAPSGKETRAARTYSANDAAKKPPASSSAPAKQPKVHAKNKRKRTEDESSDGSSAVSVSSSGREGKSGIPPQGEAPSIEGDEASPPSKKRKAASPLKKQAILRPGTRDLPRRKAAPRAEGIFSEAKSPVKSKSDFIFYDPGKRYTEKNPRQRKDLPTHCDDNAAPVKADPPDQPVRRAPRKSLKKRGTAVDKSSQEEPSAPPETLRRAPKKTLKRRAGATKTPPEDIVKVDPSAVAEPVRRASKKTLKRRGAHLTKEVTDYQICAKEDTAKEVIKSETESKSRGVHRELPLRKAASTSEGFYSESPSRSSQLRHTHASSKVRSSPLDRAKQQGIRPRSFRQEVSSSEADANAKSEPEIERTSHSRVISPSKVHVSVLERLDELEPFKEKTNTSTKQTKIDIHFRKGGASNPRKRARAHEYQQRVQPKRAKVEPLATRPLRNRKATRIFAGSSLGVSSPLVMRHRLVAS
jgi:hypothetical protein